MQKLGVWSLVSRSVVLVLMGSCVSSKPRQAPRQGVGFQLEGTSSVTKGALVTTPEAREEAFLPFVVAHAARWVTACEAERAAGEGEPSFAVATDAQAGLRPLPAPGESVFESCLAANAARTAASGLPGQTTVRVRLAVLPAR